MSQAGRAFWALILTASFVWLWVEPFLVAAALVVGLAAVAALRRVLVFGPLELLLAANVAYLLANLVLTYGSPALILSAEFLRNDGRALVLYPLLLALLAGRRALPSVGEAALARMALAAPLAIAAVGLAAYALPGLVPWRMALYYGDLGTSVFFGLHGAHNAAGVAYGAAAVLAFLAWRRERAGRLSLVAFLVLTVAFALTYSRSALLGVAVGLALLALRRELLVSPRRLALAGAWALGALALAYAVLPALPRGEGAGGAGLADPASPLHTTEYRLEAWAQAARDIGEAPLFGIGLGRFDDGPGGQARSAIGTRRDGAVVHSRAHAHSSYLHVAAETGVVGLALFAAFWLTLAYRLARAPRRLVSCAALAAIAALLVSALFEHNLAAPSATFYPALLAAAALVSSSSIAET